MPPANTLRSPEAMSAEETIAYLNFLSVFFSMSTLFEASVTAIGLFFDHSLVKSSIIAACSVEERVSHCFVTAVATTLPPLMFTVPAAVSPLSPNAERSPPEIVISVSA